MYSFPAGYVEDYVYDFRTNTTGTYYLTLNAEHDQWDPNLNNNSDTATLVINSSNGSISGYKWEDYNGDNIWDGSEPGVYNWSFYYDANSNYTWEANPIPLPRAPEDRGSIHVSTDEFLSAFPAWCRR